MSVCTLEAIEVDDVEFWPSTRPCTSGGTRDSGLSWSRSQNFAVHRHFLGLDPPRLSRSWGTSSPAPCSLPMIRSWLGKAGFSVRGSPAVSVVTQWMRTEVGGNSSPGVAAALQPQAVWLQNPSVMAISCASHRWRTPKGNFETVFQRRSATLKTYFKVTFCRSSQLT